MHDVTRLRPAIPVCCAVAIAVLGWSWTESIGDEQSPNARAPADANLANQERRVRDAIERALPAVVAIRERNVSKAAARRSLGSGVCISGDGLILSQYHVTHALDMNDPTRSRKAGDKLEVILHGGRQCKAELLGGDRTFDLSLLRIVEPKGPFPFTPVKDRVILENGDSVLKLGHPLGYQPGREAAARFGRVLCAHENLLATDCLIAGGDSGGPFFDLDGRLAGMIYGAAIPEQIRSVSLPRNDSLNAATTAALIQSRLPSMLKGELSASDAQHVFENFRSAQVVLATDQWSQGSISKTAFGETIKQARASVVSVRDSNGVVSLGTIVDASGLVVTKASVLPVSPICELPDGQIVKADVLGIEPAFDLALLRIGADKLTPIQWKATTKLAAGTFLAVPGPEELPVAIGVVSVTPRDSKGPFPSRVKPPPRARAAMPEVIGSAVQGRGYWVEYVDGRAADAGIEPGDVLLTIGEQPIRSHADLAKCVEGRWAGQPLTIRLLRAAVPRELTLRLRAEGQSVYGIRTGAFPTYFAHDAPLIERECGGPVVGLDGRAVGITIARVGPHGCVAIPGAPIDSVVTQLKSGKFADKWIEYRKAVLDRDVERRAEKASAAGKPVTLTLDELKDQLKRRRDRFQSVLVEYDVVAEAHVDPRLLVAWNVQQVRDNEETHRVGFSGTKQISEARSPSLMVWNAPLNRVESAPNAPSTVAQAIEQQRLQAVRDRQEGRTGYTSQVLLPGQRSRWLFDGMHCVGWDQFQKRMLPKPPSSFHSPDMYLTGLGLHPLDPEPTAARRRSQELTMIPKNFELYEQCRLMPVLQIEDGAACLVVEGVYHDRKEGRQIEHIDRIWFDSEVGFAPRRWERRVKGVLTNVRSNGEFEELSPGCWLAWKSKWTFFAPEWAALEYRNRPAHSFNIRLRKAQVNDVSDEAFRL
jgi:S1-C subfamily serine protease